MEARYSLGPVAYMTAVTNTVFPRPIQCCLFISGNRLPCPPLFPLFWWFQIEELYSILCVVKDLTLYCQREDEATAEGGMQRMLLLLTLEPTAPLEIVTVAQIGDDQAAATAGGGGAAGAVGGAAGAAGGAAGTAGADGAADRTMRTHADLTSLGRKVREVFCQAVGTRFLKRYTPAGLRTHAHLFDHVMLLSPRSRSLSYIDKFAASTAAKDLGLATPDAIKRRIKEEIVEHVKEAVTELRSRAAVEREMVQEPRVQRTRTPAAVTEFTVAARLRAAFDGEGSDSDSSEGDEGSSASERSPGEEAKTILNDWLKSKVRAAR